MAATSKLENFLGTQIASWVETAARIPDSMSC
jgi:hypothetical protein